VSVGSAEIEYKLFDRYVSMPSSGQCVKGNALIDKIGEET